MKLSLVLTSALLLLSVSAFAEDSAVDYGTPERDDCGVFIKADHDFKEELLKRLSNKGYKIVSYPEARYVLTSSIKYFAIDGSAFHSITQFSDKEMTDLVHYKFQTFDTVPFRVPQFMIKKRVLSGVRGIDRCSSR
jgi:hypothetical protein